MQIFAMLPLSKAGFYSGNLLVSGWDGTQNSTYIIELGSKSSQLDKDT